VNLGILELKDKYRIDKSTPFGTGKIIHGDSVDFLQSGDQVIKIDNARPFDITDQTDVTEVSTLGLSNVDAQNLSSSLTGQKCDDKSDAVLVVWEQDSDILASSCGYEYHLQNSESAHITVMGDDNRGLALTKMNNFVVLNATKTGEVWAMKMENTDVFSENDHFEIVKSTLNNWDNLQEKRQSENDQKIAELNVCPGQSRIHNFGVRLGKDNIIPVLTAVPDANSNDTLAIVGQVRIIQDQSNADFGKFRVIDDGKAIAVNLTSDQQFSAEEKGTLKETIEITVTDGGTDLNGVCLVPMQFEISIHPFDEPNNPPLHIGVDVPPDQLTLGMYPKIGKIDVLSGWYDPDGDDIYALSSDPPERGRVAVSPGGELVFKGEDIKNGESQNVSYLVYDDQGGSSISSYQFNVVDSSDVVLESVAKRAVLDREIQIDFQEFVHNVDDVWEISLDNFPDWIAAEPVKNGQSIKIISHKLGRFSFNYSIVGSEKVGNIFIDVIESSPENFTTSSMTIIMQNETNLVVDVSKLVCNIEGFEWGVTNVLSIPKFQSPTEVAANLTGVLMNGKQVKIDAYKSQSTTSTEPLFSGKFIISLEVNNDNESDQAGVYSTQLSIIIYNPVKPTVPIAMNDVAEISAGNMLDINVLENDLASDGNIIVLDDRFFDEDNIEGRGMSFSSDSVLRYVAPKNSRPGDTIIRDYWIYIDGYPQSTLAKGRVVIKIVEENFSRFSYQKDAENIQIPEAVAFRDVKYGAFGSEVKVSPFVNDLISRGLIAQIEKAELVSLGQSNPEEGTRLINGTEYSDQITLIIGEQGDTTIWELTANIISDGTNLKYGKLNTKVAISTQRIVLKTAVEQEVPQYPVIKDRDVKTSEIHGLKFYESQVGDNFVASDIFSVSQNSRWQNDAWVTAPQTDTSIGEKKVLLEGELDESDQIVLYKVVFDMPTSSLEEELEGGSKFTTFGFLIVPSINSIVPQRKNQEIKQVKAQEEPIIINLIEEIEELEGAKLVVSEIIEHQRKRPQSTCWVDGNELKYSPNLNVEKKMKDTNISDICGVYVKWGGQTKDILVNFEYSIIPELTYPTISPNVSLPGIEPKGNLSLSVAEYITWWGHSDSETASLELSCSLPQPSTDVDVNCFNQVLYISVSRNAKEGKIHEILLQIPGQNDNPDSSVDQASAFNGAASNIALWKVQILATPKVGDITIPLHSSVLLIREGFGSDGKPSAGGIQGGGSAEVDVLQDVKQWLSRPEFWDFQEGGTISCAPVQEPKITCTSVHHNGSNSDLGQLQFGVQGGADVTGFTALGRYVFTDRDATQTPNRGSGSVQIQYQALPKRPSEPVLGTSVSSTGEINLTASVPMNDVPLVTQICLNVQETGDTSGVGTASAREVCREIGLGGSSASSSDTWSCSGSVCEIRWGSGSSEGGLSWLELWKRYQFSVTTKNEVGISQVSDTLVATRFRNPSAPTLSASILPSSSTPGPLHPGQRETRDVELKITSTDTSIIYYIVNGVRILRTGNITLYTITGLDVGQTHNIDVQSLANDVVEGDFSITPTSSHVFESVLISEPEPIGDGDEDSE
jgi:hypothetical protein